PPASPATDRAIRVLPVPGGPYSNTPLGILAPTALNRSGWARKSRISPSSSTASSTPATSLKRTFGVSLVTCLALDLPKFIMRELPPCMRDMMNQNSPTRSTTVSRVISRLDHHGVCGTTELYPLGGSAAATASATSSACGV